MLTNRVLTMKVLLAAAFAPLAGIAQEYPVRPVRVIVPNAAGSLNDSVARVIATKLTDALGQQFIVDNRAGASGNIAAELAARAPADGHTLFYTVNTVMVVNPALFAKVAFDPLRDFESVSMMVKISEVLVAHPSVGAKSLEDFVRIAKAKPGAITYASGGNAHPTHLMMELFQRKAGLKLVHVPYKGTSPAMLALVAGEASAYNIGIGLARPHITAGRVTALAKTGYPAKDALPGVPALTTLYPDAEYIPWQALFAPKGTPAAVIAKLNKAVVAAFAAPDVQSRMKDLDLTAAPGTPVELDKIMRADMAVNRELVKAIGLKLD